MRLRGIYFLAVAASVAAVLVLAGPASAANPPFSCGATITSGTFTLIGNLDCTGYSGTALTVDPGAGKTVTLNLGKYTITAESGHDVIFVYGPGTTTINGGTLVTSGDADGVELAAVAGATVSGTTIIGDGESHGYAGVSEGGGYANTVTGATISGFTYGVYLDGTINDLVTKSTITLGDNGSYEFYGEYGVYDGGGTNNAVTGNTISDGATGPEAPGVISGVTPDAPPDPVFYFGGGVRADHAAGTVISGNTMFSLKYGVNADDHNAGLWIQNNVIGSSAVDNMWTGIVFHRGDSADVISGNYVRNTVIEGINDYESFNNTYTGNVLTSGGDSADPWSYQIDPNGYGPVTMTNNYAREGCGSGFVILEAYTDSVPGPPYSMITGNHATANGGGIDCSGDWAGFYSTYLVGATFSNNTAYQNNGEGFVFTQPWRTTISGNLADGNSGDGFAFDATGTDSQPLAVMNNTAIYNGNVGFISYDDPVAGSGNKGNGTNGLIDCVLVSGCS